MVIVRIPEVFAKYAGGRERLSVDASTAGDALRVVAAQHPQLRERLFDGAGTLRSHLSVAVGDVVVRRETLDAVPIDQGDEVVVLAALAGG